MNNPRYLLCRFMDPHRNKVQELCRACGRVLVARGERQRAISVHCVFRTTAERLWD